MSLATSKIKIALTLAVSLLSMSMMQTAKADWKVSTADIDNDGWPDVVIEGVLLRAAIAARGGGLTGLFDKLRGHEEAKVLPTAEDDGLNQLRISGIPNDADKVRYEITHRAGENGTYIVEAVGDATLNISEEKVGPMRVTQRYIFEPNSTRLRVWTRFENKSAQDVNFVPWIKHLLRRDGAEPTDVAFMTPYGVYDSNKPIPGRGGQMFQGNVHYLTSSNWISRTPAPLDSASNTLSSVASPQRMFKVYAWKKQSENFVTQEFILAPRVLKPGGSDEYEYFIALTAPLKTPSYSSPLLNIEVTPHPMGLPATTTELAVRIAATRDLGDVEAAGQLKRLDAVEAPQPVTLKFSDLKMSSAASATFPVKLAANGRYQLDLNFKSGGKAFLPGAEIGDNDAVRIPLVVDKTLPTEISYASRVSANLFPKIKPQKIDVPLAAKGKGVQVFRVPALQRVFEADVLSPSTAKPQPVRLEAGANEYQSFQLVLTAEGKTPSTFSVEATPLSGEGEARVEVDRISRMLYAETFVPSGYNPNFGLGRYPEGLLETQNIEVRPGVTSPLFFTYRVPRKTPPGKYSGEITLKSQVQTFKIPVEMQVWNYELPVRPPLDIIADPKAGGASVIPIYFRYKITPAHLPKLVGALQNGDFETVDKELPALIEQGMTRTYLGNAMELPKRIGVERIKAIDAFLKSRGWTDYFYVRAGFDEASPDKVPEIKHIAQEWKKISTIPVMETYYYDVRADELYGLLDIYSRSYSKAPWIQERMKKGDKFWKVNSFPGALENAPRDTWGRYLAMADYNFTGTYIWTLSAWREAEWGKDWWADEGVSNLSATLVWKDPSGLLPTMRLESLRDAIEGYSLYDLLKKRVENPRPNDSPKLLRRARALFADPPLWKRIKTDADVETIHREMGEVLSGLNSQ